MTEINILTYMYEEINIILTQLPLLKFKVRNILYI